MRCLAECFCNLGLAAGLTLFLVHGSVVTATAEKYDSKGKRDPFMSLLSSVNKPDPVRIVLPPPLEERPPGLPGLLVDEVIPAEAGGAEDGHAGADEVHAPKAADELDEDGEGSPELPQGRERAAEELPLVMRRRSPGPGGPVAGLRRSIGRLRASSCLVGHLAGWDGCPGAASPGRVPHRAQYVRLAR